MSKEYSITQKILIGLGAMAGVVGVAVAVRFYQRRPKKTVKPGNLIILGGPSAGKSTQCKKLVDFYHGVHISAGDLLRAHVNEGSDLGKEAQPYMANGQLVPDRLIIDIVVEELQKLESKGVRWILDGFPRTPQQAEALKSKNLVPKAILLLSIPDDQALKRSAGRLEDPITKAIYHTTFFPPPEAVKGRLVQRNDDKEHIVRNRIANFKKVYPLVDSEFSSVVPKYEINGDHSKEAVWELIKKSLDAAGVE